MSFDPIWLAALPGVLAVVLWALNDLPRFVLLAVLSTMILPRALLTPGGAQLALSDVLLLLAVAAWVVLSANGRSPILWRSSNYLLVPFLVFVGVNAVSLLWSEDRGQTVQFTTQAVEILVILPVVFASVPRALKEVRKAMALFVVVSCGLALVYAGFARDDALAGGLGKNTAGTFIAAGLVMAFALSLLEGSKLRQRLLALAIFVELGGLFATASRGSLTGALAAILLMTLLLERRRALTAVLVIVAATAFLAAGGASSGAQLEISGAYDTRVVRQYSFEGAWRKIQQRPFLGTGGGTYSDYLQPIELAVADPNNIFLLTWAEIGIPGLLALAFILLRSARLLWSIRRRPPEAATLGVGAGCVALSLLVHFQVDVSWTRGTTTLLYAMLALMLAVDRLAATAPPQPSVLVPAIADPAARTPVRIS